MNDRAVELCSPPASRAGQFSTVHALRGIAAFWVVLFHSYKFGSLAGLQLQPDSLFTLLIFGWGRGGVAMFFVISGFVIAPRLRDARPDLRFVGRFMLRRSIRLDPPYWVSIGVALALSAAIAFSNGRSAEWPSFGGLLAHLFYLQELLQIPEIQVVYWTLTYEIQFYLVYVLALAVQHHWPSKAPSVSRIIVPTLLIGSAFVAAFATREWVLHGLFLNYWHPFVAGVLAYYGGVHRNRLAAVLLIGLVIAMLLSAPATVEVFNSPAALTATGLYLAGSKKGLLSRMTAAPLQFLGTISYSLYLLHVPSILVAMSVSLMILDGGTVGGSLAMFAAVIGASLISASIFWWAIERPSHQLAKHLKLRKSADTTVNPPESPSISSATTL